MDKHYTNNQAKLKKEEVIVNGYIPFEMQMTARFVLDEICYKANITYIKEQIDLALDQGNEAAFEKYSKLYKEYLDK